MSAAASAALERSAVKARSVLSSLHTHLTSIPTASLDASDSAMLPQCVSLLTALTPDALATTSPAAGFPLVARAYHAVAVYFHGKRRFKDAAASFANAAAVFTAVKDTAKARACLVHKAKALEAAGRGAAAADPAAGAPLLAEAVGTYQTLAASASSTANTSKANDANSGNDGGALPSLASLVLLAQAATVATRALLHSADDASRHIPVVNNTNEAHDEATDADDDASEDDDEDDGDSESAVVVNSAAASAPPLSAALAAAAATADAVATALAANTARGAPAALALWQRVLGDPRLRAALAWAPAVNTNATAATSAHGNNKNDARVGKDTVYMVPACFMYTNTNNNSTAAAAADHSQSGPRKATVAAAALPTLLSLANDAYAALTALADRLRSLGLRGLETAVLTLLARAFSAGVAVAAHTVHAVDVLTVTHTAGTHGTGGAHGPSTATVAVLPRSVESAVAVAAAVGAEAACVGSAGCWRGHVKKAWDSDSLSQSNCNRLDTESDEEDVSACSAILSSHDAALWVRAGLIPPCSCSIHSNGHSNTLGSNSNSSSNSSSSPGSASGDSSVLESLLAPVLPAVPCSQSWVPRAVDAAAASVAGPASLYNSDCDAAAAAVPLPVSLDPSRCPSALLLLPVLTSLAEARAAAPYSSNDSTNAFVSDSNSGTGALGTVAATLACAGQCIAPTLSAFTASKYLSDGCATATAHTQLPQSDSGSAVTQSQSRTGKPAAAKTGRGKKATTVAEADSDGADSTVSSPTSAAAVRVFHSLQWTMRVATAAIALMPRFSRSLYSGGSSMQSAPSTLAALATLICTTRSSDNADSASAIVGDPSQSLLRHSARLLTVSPSLARAHVAAAPASASMTGGGPLLPAAAAHAAAPALLPTPVFCAPGVRAAATAAAGWAPWRLALAAARCCLALPTPVTSSATATETAAVAVTGSSVESVSAVRLRARAEATLCLHALLALVQGLGLPPAAAAAGAAADSAAIAAAAGKKSPAEWVMTATLAERAAVDASPASVSAALALVAAAGAGTTIPTLSAYAATAAATGSAAAAAAALLAFASRPWASLLKLYLAEATAVLPAATLTATTADLSSADDAVTAGGGTVAVPGAAMTPLLLTDTAAGVAAGVIATAVPDLTNDAAVAAAAGAALAAAAAAAASAASTVSSEKALEKASNCHLSLRRTLSCLLRLLTAHTAGGSGKAVIAYAAELAQLAARLRSPPLLLRTATAAAAAARALGRVSTAVTLTTSARAPLARAAAAAASANTGCGSSDELEAEAALAANEALRQPVQFAESESTGGVGAAGLALAPALLAAALASDAATQALLASGNSATAADVVGEIELVDIVSLFSSPSNNAETAAPAPAAAKGKGGKKATASARKPFAAAAVTAASLEIGLDSTMLTLWALKGWDTAETLTSGSKLTAAADSDEADCDEKAAVKGKAKAAPKSKAAATKAAKAAAEVETECDGSNATASVSGSLAGRVAVDRASLFLTLSHNNNNNNNAGNTAATSLTAVQLLSRAIASTGAAALVAATAEAAATASAGDCASDNDCDWLAPSHFRPRATIASKSGGKKSAARAALASQRSAACPCLSTGESDNNTCGSSDVHLCAGADAGITSADTASAAADAFVLTARWLTAVATPDANGGTASRIVSEDDHLQLRPPTLAAHGAGILLPSPGAVAALSALLASTASSSVTNAVETAAAAGAVLSAARRMLALAWALRAAHGCLDPEASGAIAAAAAQASVHMPQQQQSADGAAGDDAEDAACGCAAAVAAAALWHLSLNPAAAADKRALLAADSAALTAAATAAGVVTAGKSADETLAAAMASLSLSSASPCGKNASGEASGPGVAAEAARVQMAVMAPPRSLRGYLHRLAPTMFAMSSSLNVVVNSDSDLNASAAGVDSEGLLQRLLPPWMAAVALTVAPGARALSVSRLTLEPVHQINDAEDGDTENDEGEKARSEHLLNQVTLQSISPVTTDTTSEDACTAHMVPSGFALTLPLLPSAGSAESRDSNASQHSLASVMSSLSTLLEQNERSQKAAPGADSPDAVAQWWTTRFEIEFSLMSLLTHAERAFFGPWAGVLRGLPTAPAAAAKLRRCASVLADNTSDLRARLRGAVSLGCAIPAPWHPTTAAVTTTTAASKGKSKAFTVENASAPSPLILHVETLLLTLLCSPLYAAAHAPAFSPSSDELTALATATAASAAAAAAASGEAASGGDLPAPPPAPGVGAYSLPGAVAWLLGLAPSPLTPLASVTAVITALTTAQLSISTVTASVIVSATEDTEDEPAAAKPRSRAAPRRGAAVVEADAAEPDAAAAPAVKARKGRSAAAVSDADTAAPAPAKKPRAGTKAAAAAAAAAASSAAVDGPVCLVTPPVDLTALAGNVFDYTRADAAATAAGSTAAFEAALNAGAAVSPTVAAFAQLLSAIETAASDVAAVMAAAAANSSAASASATVSGCTGARVSRPVVLTVSNELTTLPFESLPVLRPVEHFMPPVLSTSDAAANADSDTPAPAAAKKGGRVSAKAAAAATPVRARATGASRSHTHVHVARCGGEFFGPQRVARMPTLMHTLAALGADRAVRLVRVRAAGAAIAAAAAAARAGEPAAAAAAATAAAAAAANVNLVGLASAAANADTVGVSVSPQQAYYILNPGSDLPKTQARLQPFFEALKGWRGITATKPTPKYVDNILIIRAK